MRSRRKRSACPDHPTYLYSPVFTAVEQHLSIANGIYGLPEGVLPTPAHSHIVSSNASGADAQWYVMQRFGNSDPNIMPNATTGKCTQVVPSNLTNATGNCLTSLAALQRALVTTSSDVFQVNQNNPIYQTLAGNTTIRLQVVVPGDTVVTIARCKHQCRNTICSKCVELLQLRRCSNHIGYING